MADVDLTSDSDLYAEEEKVFDFGEEEDTDDPYDPSVPPSLLKDYGGEDFSQYLNDDEYNDDGIELTSSAFTPSTEVSSLFRSAEQNEDDDGNFYDTIQTVSSSQTYHDAGHYRQTDNAQIQPADYNSHSDRQNKTNKTNKFSRLLKDQFDKAAHTIRLRTKRQPTEFQNDQPLSTSDNNSNKISNFSFADSKMGYSLTSILKDKQTISESTDENADSGIGVDNADISEELGMQSTSWWSLGTLSSAQKSSPSSTVSSSSKSKKQRSSSTQFLNKIMSKDSRTDLSGSKHDLSGSKRDLSGSKRDLSGSKHDLSGSKNDLRKNSVSRMWDKVTGSLKKKQSKNKTTLTIQTEEMRL